MEEDYKEWLRYELSHRVTFTIHDTEAAKKRILEEITNTRRMVKRERIDIVGKTEEMEKELMESVRRYYRVIEGLLDKRRDEIEELYG